jgi:hypothetical protein
MNAGAVPGLQEPEPVALFTPSDASGQRRGRVMSRRAPELTTFVSPG